MAFKPILTKTTWQCTLVLTTRSSVLRPREAKLDRYDIIRTFFNSQSNCGEKRTSSPSYLREETHYSALTRHFHSSRRVSDSDRREAPKPPINENDLKALAKGTDGAPSPNYDNYPPFFRRLAMSMPHLPRPSPDDFPKIATGFWPRANPIQMVHDQVLSAVQCGRHLGLYYLVRHEPDALNIRGDVSASPRLSLRTVCS
jgi:distribution and morphology protein 31